MEDNAKVFSSDITRGQRPLENNLQDLIKVLPAKPTFILRQKDHNFQFEPKAGKLYVQKKRTKPLIKVRTVREIRRLFESDVIPDLSKDLEKQQSYLLKKITSGSFREEKTKSVAKSMLKSEKPISRSSWQMLMNLNPHGKFHPIQYVLWDGRCIRVNGSTGGKNKFLCNYDLQNNRKMPKKENKTRMSKKSGLLCNSLNIRFKPGPLTKKKLLDDSYQKYNVGNIELVNLPRPGLDIQPKYGIPLEPTIINYVHNLREVNGAITKKWAEFSVSVLGGIKNQEAVQNTDDPTVSFELSYKNDQRRMLMRRDVDASGVDDIRDCEIVSLQKSSDKDINSEVELMLNQIIESIEISLQQDNFYSGEDESREQDANANSGEVNTGAKDKNKKRYSELNRLDVTVIRLPEAPEDDTKSTCTNAHCSLGCVCSSLQRSFNIKQHCGRLECMFQCKCDFSKYKTVDSFGNDCKDFLPGLINLDNELNLNLAKEEQKFHQTVLMTGESIILKSKKRNWKPTKRYSNFLNKMCLKNDIKHRELLSVVDIKLNLENVEPWCMVHNLYKCFCGGKFTESSYEIRTDEKDLTKLQEEEVADSTKTYSESKDKMRPRPDKKTEESNRKLSDTEITTNHQEIVDLDMIADRLFGNSSCARTRQFEGRKYDESYYINANKRIIEMEANDDKLRKKMMTIMGKADNIEELLNPSKNSVVSVESNDDNSRTESLSCAVMDSSSSDLPGTSTASVSSENDNVTPIDRSILNHSANKAKLISWVEASYKQYKRRVDQGIVKKSLDPPKHGRVALYPWEFVLSRYKERKNLFLVTKEKPYRIFMAVDDKNILFKNCMNIDEIRFAELHKYPSTVKNLLTNATDLKDNFIILCGLSCCWELTGSVTKVDDKKNVSSTNNSSNVLQLTMNQSPSKTETSIRTENPPYLKENQNSITETSNSSELRRSLRKIRKKRRYSDSEDVDMPKAVQKSKESSKIQQVEIMPNALQNGKESAIVQQVKSAPEKTVQVQELPESSNESKAIDNSKWFVMTIENDFTEIQFYKKGFFVKYESIIKAINVARMSGKTVRLSSKKCDEANEGPQFGIYAIPNANEYYVFVGPYEKDESLGIEIVKTFLGPKPAQSTRGVWITTQKLDNIKVIENPLAFMPPNNAQSSNVPIDETVSKPFEPIVTHRAIDETVSQSSATTVRLQPDSEKNVSDIPGQKNKDKVIKPIKIRKTNGFYQLAPHGLKKLAPKTYGSAKGVFGKGLLQSILKVDQKNLPIIPISVNPGTSASLSTKSNANDNHLASSKPIAEIAPQIKIVDVFSQSESVSRSNSEVSINPERGMLILKPEEINKRLMEKKIDMDSFKKEEDDQKEDLEQDIENFLATSSVFVPPNAEIFEISDDDEAESNGKPNYKPVWIECTNIQRLGYLCGRRNNDNLISFEFPGFKYTDYYEEQEAFSKINQVFSRKVYVPKKIVPQWHVVDSYNDLEKKNQLEPDELGSDFVLTKEGLRHKRLLLASLKKRLEEPTPPSAQLKNMLASDDIDSAIDNLSELDEQIKNLEEEGNMLLSEMVSTRSSTSSGTDPAHCLNFVSEDRAILQNISASLEDANISEHMLSDYCDK